jgi:hypothetical protein
MEEARDELDAYRSKNHALILANKRANADYEQLILQQEAADKEIARLERSIDDLQSHYDTSQQRLSKEILRLEADSLELNKQLDESGLRIQNLNKQLSEANALAAKHEATSASWEREVRSRDDEMAKMREVLNERDRLTRDKDGLLQELAQARRETSEVRSQWQCCAAEKAHVEEVCSIAKSSNSPFIPSGNPIRESEFNAKYRKMRLLGFGLRFSITKYFYMETMRIET